jgi:hypothetical protein
LGVAQRKLMEQGRQQFAAASFNLITLPGTAKRLKAAQLSMSATWDSISPFPRGMRASAKPQPTLRDQSSLRRSAQSDPPIIRYRVKGGYIAGQPVVFTVPVVPSQECLKGKLPVPWGHARGRCRVGTGAAWSRPPTAPPARILATTEKARWLECRSQRIAAARLLLILSCCVLLLF